MDSEINKMRQQKITTVMLEPIPKVVESDESFVIRYAPPESSTGGAEMWKPEHRRAAERRGLRYPSDLTDAEWALVEPMIPPAKRGGRRREVNVREVLNAIFYVLSTGCQWQALPKGPAAEEHGAFVLHAVGLGRNVRARPPRALRRHARARGP